MIVTVAPLAMLPTVQVTVPFLEAQVPWVEVAEIKPAALGKVSMAFTLLAAPWPLFLTTIVYVSRWPVLMGSGASVLVTDRSAEGRHASFPNIVYEPMSPKSLDWSWVTGWPSARLKKVRAWRAPRTDPGPTLSTFDVAMEMVMVPPARL